MKLPRDLLPDERHFLDVLLSPPFEGRDELLAQAQVVSVGGLSCKCGCPSVTLEVDPVAPSASVKGVFPEGVGVDQEGNIVSVILHVDDRGYMNEIDVSPFGGNIDGRHTKGAWGKPTVESFELIEWEPDADGMSGTIKNMPGRWMPYKPRQKSRWRRLAALVRHLRASR